MQDKEKTTIEARQKYISAFNTTMIKIWRENITRLGVIDTGRLLSSLVGLQTDADGRVTTVTLRQSFLEYGIYQDAGTGKEVPKGNPGDIGRDKVRERRLWFSRKYYSSYMNLRDFMAESLGSEFVGIIGNFLNNGFKLNL